jgi:hypothetical protein
MGINLDAIRGRLNTLKNANNRTSNIWKPEPGEHQIRIVPYVHNTENPFLELYFHYNLGKKSTLSPISFGRPDPIVEFAEKLKQTGDKEDWIAGRKLEPKMRTYVPVLVRGQEKEGVKFWGFGKQVYESILGFIADPDYGDITDLKEGRDVVVTVKSAEEAGRNYAETTIRIKPKQTPATDNPDIVAKIKEQPKITELYPEPTYDDLKIQLQTWMGSNESEESDGGEEVTKSNSTKNTVTTNEVEKAFDDLFN